MTFVPVYIRATMDAPDTVWGAWEKTNLNVEGIYNDLLDLESELGDVEEIDGGLVE